MATNPRVRGSSVLITGCSTGIGQACALELAERGWRVFAGVRRPEDGQRLCEQAGGVLQPVILDVTDGSAIRAVVEQLRAAVGEAGLNGLVNNAGIAVPGPLELLPTDEFRRQLEVNVLGTHAVTRALLPLLRPAAGRIVLIGSISGRVTPPHFGAYAASKHALEAIADALRMELRPWNMPVSIVEPDNVDTPIWNKFESSVLELTKQADADTGRLYEQQMQRIRQSAHRLGRTGMPTRHVVAAVRHALSARRPKARYPVGLRTRLAIWGAGNLPASWMDWFLRNAVGG
jgi:NAD(P)-dependent dehydrogenase (short-subunit alcohol dehydrogenase family)